jgi:hypothetical protein
MGLVKVKSNGSMTSAFQVSSRLPEIRANGLATTNIALETTVRPTPRTLTGTSTMIAVEEGGLFLADAEQLKLKDARSRLIMSVLRQSKAIMLSITYLKKTKNWSVV